MDVDECVDQGPAALCPAPQPDCINTPGAYLCMCLAGYDNATSACRGSENLGPRPPPQIAPVNPKPPRVNTPRVIVPVIIGQLPFRSRNGTASTSSSRTTTTTTTTTTAPFAPRTILPVRTAPRNFPIPNRPASRRRRPTTAAPSFAFGADYDYDYEDSELHSAVTAAVATQLPFTPPSTLSTARPPWLRARAGVVTPRIIQVLSVFSFCFYSSFHFHTKSFLSHPSFRTYFRLTTSAPLQHQ